MSRLKVFVDSDVILDFLLQREPYNRYGNIFMEKCEKQFVEAYTTAVVLANVYYIAKMQSVSANLNAQMQMLLTLIKIFPIGKENFMDSLNSNFKDFEDGLQNFAAVAAQMDAIITRNTKDYTHSTLQVCTPQEIITQIQAD